MTKVLFANTTAKSGGAARAAQRLYNGLQQHSDLDLSFTALYDEGLTGIKTPKSQSYAKFRHKTERALTKVAGKPTASYFSVSTPLPPAALTVKPDLIHLHWINGFITLKQLVKLQVPVVWTLHDMWLFTGGCHYDQHCGGYLQQCDNCPMLTLKSFAKQEWRRKQALFEKLNLTIITPSRWLADEAKKSSLLRDKPVHVIPNAIDTTVYKPLNKQKAKKALGIAKDAKVILVGAVKVDQDTRKGLDLLKQALEETAIQKLKNVVLLVLGSQQDNTETLGNITIKHTGFLESDEQLRQAFNAADITVVPSRQENLANMLTESIACGTPVAGFDIGGNSDLIRHQETGWLSPAFATDHLAAGLTNFLGDTAMQVQWSENTRNIAAETLGLSTIAAKHNQIYQTILQTDL